MTFSLKMMHVNLSPKKTSPFNNSTTMGPHSAHLCFQGPCILLGGRWEVLVSNNGKGARTIQHKEDNSTWARGRGGEGR